MGNSPGIHLTNASDAELSCFLWSAPKTNGWANNRDVGDLRRHGAHCDVTLMVPVNCRGHMYTGRYLGFHCACRWPGTTRWSHLNLTFLTTSRNERIKIGSYSYICVYTYTHICIYMSIKYANIKYLVWCYKSDIFSLCCDLAHFILRLEFRQRDEDLNYVEINLVYINSILYVQLYCSVSVKMTFPDIYIYVAWY